VASGRPSSIVKLWLLPPRTRPSHRRGAASETRRAPCKFSVSWVQRGKAGGAVSTTTPRRVDLAGSGSIIRRQSTGTTRWTILAALPRRRSGPPKVVPYPRCTLSALWRSDSYDWSTLLRDEWAHTSTHARWAESSTTAGSWSITISPINDEAVEKLVKSRIFPTLSDSRAKTES